MTDTEIPTTTKASAVVTNAENKTQANTNDDMNNDDNQSDPSRSDVISDLKLVEDKTANDNDDDDDDAVLSDTTHSASAQFQLMTDRALRFLSHASNETLGACLVGLGASTYLVLGRVGLMLIGLVGGIALHASWEAHGESTGAVARDAQVRKQRELGLDLVQRLLTWRAEKSSLDQDSDGDEQEVKVVAKRKLDFSTFRPKTAAALSKFTDAVVRDYVKWWYAPVLPGEESFPLACRHTLTAFILSLSNRLSRKRPVDVFLDFVTNSSSIVIVFLNELSAALNASPNSPATDAVAAYLDLKPDSSLANILDQEHQEKKLTLVADDILKSYLDAKAYDCLPVQVFLRQVLAKLVLSMTIDTCSKPDWINGWIVYLLEDGEPALMDAIDAGLERSANVNPEQKTAEKHVAVAEGTVSPVVESANTAHHKRTRSRAEEAMDDAMKEAQRLTQLIQEEEARRAHSSPPRGLDSSHENISESTTEGMPTPVSSSQSESGRHEESEERPPFEMSPTSKPPPLEDTSPTSRSQPFTNFEQILPNESSLKPAPTLTLFNAKISVFDDSVPGDRSSIKSKPTAEYMIQVEPLESKFPGWMIVRRYADFETLNEVLIRISKITGVGFLEAHPNLPAWKVHTKASLRGELERYLCDAVCYKQLAESEGMKRFLDKDQGLTRSPGEQKGFGWPTPAAFDQMGKSMMDVLTKAPREVAGGGKSFFGGVAGVLGGKKTPGHASSPSSASRSSVSLAQNYMEDSYMGSLGCDAPRQSSESIRSLSSVQRKTSLQSSAPIDIKPRPSISTRSSIYGRQSTDLKRTESRTSSAAIGQSPRTPLEDLGRLLPPLSTSDTSEDNNLSRRRSVLEQEQPPRRGEGMTYSSPASRRASSQSLALAPEAAETPSRPSSSHKSRSPAPPVARAEKAKPPVTEQETQVAVELLFAVITELYTLSSAWQIRRTLLNAAKTFLLRPGNPQLEAIRVLIQESVIDSNTSDSGIAAHIETICASSLPTEEERKKWPEQLDDKAKDELRVKARKLLVERGMPVALTGVMGQAATGEALGRVFDCLQNPKLARGLIFGLMLQGLRGIVQ